ncbi:MAG: periplasmic heavy metal sensor [Pseudomonadota bacterium]
MNDTYVTPPSSRSRLGLILLASLVVNLFLIGVIATAVWKHRGDMDRPNYGGPMSFLFGDIKGAKSDMTGDDRAALRKMMMGHFKTIRPRLDEIDEARKALARALAETPYDQAKVAAGFQRIEAAQLAVGAEMRAVMVKGFGDMNDAQRQRLGKIMEQNAERDWRRKRRGHDNDSDGPPPPQPDQ